MTMTARNLIFAAIASAITATAAQPAFAYTDLFPYSSFEYIPNQELAVLDCYELWLARNEIYHRNDYRFKTAKAQAVFGYDGQQDNPKLGTIEYANVKRIQTYEKANYCG
jgi:hypothetical protein